MNIPRDAIVFFLLGKSPSRDPSSVTQLQGGEVFAFMLFTHASKISSKRWRSSAVKRLASQFSVCKWGYAFLCKDKVMRTSSDTMVKPCFVSGTEKGHTFTKMATCTRANGNGTKSTDMVFISIRTEKCEPLASLSPVSLSVNKCKVDTDTLCLWIRMHVD